MDPVESLPSVTLNEVLDYIHEETVVQRDSFSTGSKQLDYLFGNGVNRGKIVEISGPPGSGKTTIGLSVCKEALSSRNRVLWVSTTQAMIPLSRLKELSEYSPEMLHWLTFVRVSSLSQLIILFKKANLGNDKNALVVIEDLAFLFNLSITIGTSNMSVDEDQNRRLRTMFTVIDTLDKFAKAANTGVLILSSVMTRPGGSDALPKLIPGLGYGSWQNLISQRIILFRNERGGYVGRYAKRGYEEVEFRITRDGISDIEDDESGIEDEIEELIKRRELLSSEGSIEIKKTIGDTEVEITQEVVTPESELTESPEVAQSEPEPTEDAREDTEQADLQEELAEAPLSQAAEPASERANPELAQTSGPELTEYPEVAQSESESTEDAKEGIEQDEAPLSQAAEPASERANPELAQTSEPELTESPEVAQSETESTEDAKEAIELAEAPLSQVSEPTAERADPELAQIADPELTESPEVAQSQPEPTEDAKEAIELAETPLSQASEPTAEQGDLELAQTSDLDQSTCRIQTIDSDSSKHPQLLSPEQPYTLQNKTTHSDQLSLVSIYKSIPDSPPTKKQRISSSLPDNSTMNFGDIIPDEIPNSQPEYSDSEIIML